MPKNTRPIAATLLFGAGSIVIYTALLMNDGLLIELAQRTKNGEYWLFLVPIIIAFLFSYIHGTFTGLFWETLGVRAANQTNNKNK